MNIIRQKLLDFKKRLSDRKMYSIVILLVTLVSGWGIYQYKRASDYRQELDNQYNRAFFDMTGYVQNVETLLLKALVSNTPYKTTLTLKEAWRQANLAQENLGLLPVTQSSLANTSRFLTQVGDLSYSLSNQYSNGNAITDDQYGVIKKLNSYASNLRENLYDLQNQITNGRIKWDELSKKGTQKLKKTSANMPKSQFESLDKTFQEYPSLIYDGPFSDHMTNIKPRGLSGPKLDSSEAKASVYGIFPKQKVDKITFNGKVASDSIPTYSYSVELKGNPDNTQATLSVTQTGGMLLWFLLERETGEQNLNMLQAKEKASIFLNKVGYKNMVDTYFLIEDGTATINYAYQQNDVVIYPDLIKVKVALDNGEIVGLDAKNYLTSHTNRDLKKPGISMEQAKNLVSPNLEIANAGLAIIPTDYQTEKYVYEFKGKVDSREFIIYINADTGQEEEILLIIDTPNGVLTM